VVKIVGNGEKVRRSIPAQLLRSDLVNTWRNAEKTWVMARGWLIPAQSCAKRMHEQFLRK
jgi:hypothetical protein